ncbi:class I SAM-dependent methyltransferase [Castellaniella hirudinis]|uniref:class I SAM-dependent methyltransferase n=1 Tax=Castellaniella hirudinis TaxID=1144617 RepID=UPI0039C0E4FB
MSNDEKSRLENISKESLYAAGANTDSIIYSFLIARRHFRGSTLLEMGPAEGVMTQRLVTLGMDLTVVEGSKKFCEDLKNRFPEISVENYLFEEFKPAKKFDNIVLGHVLEHVEDPVEVLSRARTWLAPGGRIYGSVPNARSLHRQAAVIMGLLPAEDTLNSLDLHHGHRRVFNPETFRQAFFKAGLNIDLFGGYWMKPLSNAQIEATWTPQMMEAFMTLGERYPDIAGEIYVLATNPNL